MLFTDQNLYQKMFVIDVPSQIEYVGDAENPNICVS